MTKYEVLERLYKNLLCQLIESKKHKNKSLLFDIMKVKSNTRISMLDESAEDITNIDQSILKDLLNEKLIKENEHGNYFITARGVWEIENQNNDLVDKLIDFFEIEYFTNKDVDKDLNNREKVILLAMIAIRAFNTSNALNLKSTERIKDSCGEILDILYDHLMILNILKQTTNNFYGQPGNEHKVSNVIRHTDALPKKTKMIYVNGLDKEQQYYLNIFEDGEINKDKLKYLIKKIFGDINMSYNDIKEINKTLKEIAYQYGPHIYEDIYASFVKTDYDQIISDSIEEALMGF